MNRKGQFERHFAEISGILGKTLKRKGKRRIRDALRNCLNLGSTLNYTHKEGIIHFYIIGEKIIELLFLKPNFLTIQIKDCF